MGNTLASEDKESNIRKINKSDKRQENKDVQRSGQTGDERGEINLQIDKTTLTIAVMEDKEK